MALEGTSHAKDRVQLSSFKEKKIILKNHILTYNAYCIKTTIQIPIWLMDGNATLQPASMNNYYLQLHDFWSSAKSLHNGVCPVFTACFHC